MLSTINTNDLRHRRAIVREKGEAMCKTAMKAGRDLTASEQTAFDDLMGELKDINQQLDDHAKGAHGGGKFESVFPMADSVHFGGTPGQPEELKEALDGLTAFVRTGRIVASDSPLRISDSPAGGLAATVPVQVLNALRSYYANDAFRLAGATIYNTDNTIPLIKPIVSAGADLEVFAEGLSATDSHPMQIDSFTFRGDKISRLVKASEVSLMNSDLYQQGGIGTGAGSGAGDLGGEILNELVVAVTNTATKMATTGMMSALHGNSACYIEKGVYADIYGALLALMLAVPPRFAAPTNTFMLSRADLRIVKDVRSTQNEPLFDPESNTIFGHPVVINDSLHHVVYGDWSAGAFLRKSPFVLQRLIELYSANGYVGFKATQFFDSKFLASVPAVTVQPLYYTNLETAGS